MDLSPWMFHKVFKLTMSKIAFITFFSQASLHLEFPFLMNGRYLHLTQIKMLEVWKNKKAKVIRPITITP